MSRVKALVSNYLTDSDKLNLSLKYNVSLREVTEVLKGCSSHPNLFADALNIALSNCYLLMDKFKSGNPIKEQ